MKVKIRTLFECLLETTESDPGATKWIDYYLSFKD